MKDLIIIGAGPCGLAAAVEAQKNNLDYIVIEKGCIVNNITKFPTYVRLFGEIEDFEIDSIPFSLPYGLPDKNDMMKYYYKITEYFGLSVHQYEEVLNVSKLNPKQQTGFKVSTNKGEYETKNVVFATGFVDNPRKFNVPGEELDKVKPMFTEAHYYANQKVIVVGTGHSGLEAICDLVKVNAQVTLVHRGSNLSYTPKRWMMANVRKAIDEGKITAHFNSTVREITSKKVTIETLDGVKEIENDFVLRLIGFQPNYEPLKALGVNFDSVNNIPKFDKNSFETNVKGVYCCGVVAGGSDVNTVTISDGRFHGIKIVQSILNKKEMNDFNIRGDYRCENLLLNY
ncbi:MULTISPECIES: YpdA family putative bacillithiol disulfide reductase [unclassified Bacillus (in: firmicutes)]|uniref:YpdA family putative bacillithiol disulfide reductase n=1 Tax=unclassified Bacillus (in: firmicutes) TaxID=185979 RepID=UPI000696A519|nr:MULTISPECIES: YpdA family putative bacillithiol disulfide reductase [unclassified Bacillus (in: firmicutes)]